jgi:hypothetical protein
MGEVEGGGARRGDRGTMPGLVDEPLQVDGVEGAVEFEAGVFEAAGFDETGGAVEAEAWFLVGGDDGNDGAMAEGAGAMHEIVQEHFAQAAALVVGVDVEGVFDGEPPAGARVKGTERAPGEDVIILLIDGDGDGMLGGAVGEPALAFFEGDGLVDPGTGGAADEVIEDGVDGGEIVGGCRTNDGHRRGPLVQ